MIKMMRTVFQDVKLWRLVEIYWNMCLSHYRNHLPLK